MGKAEIVLSYPNFQIWKFEDKYYCYEPESFQMDVFPAGFVPISVKAPRLMNIDEKATEVQMVGRFWGGWCKDIKIENLIGLMEADYTGEEINTTDYLYFDTIKVK